MPQEGNTIFSDSALKAIKRIRTLRTISEETGLQTREEQFRVLLALDDDDAVTVARATNVRRVK